MNSVTYNTFSIYIAESPGKIDIASKIAKVGRINNNYGIISHKYSTYNLLL